MTALIHFQGTIEAVMQYDGNFELHDTYGKLKWSTGTKSNIPSNLILQNDGNLVLYDGNMSPIWATNTWNN